MIRTINISQDYTRFPGGRYPEDGTGNGTDFRRSFLLPVLRAGDHAKVILDGVVGYPSSFLEEAFGGLVRKEGFTAEEVLEAFSFEAKEPGFSRYASLIADFVRRAVPARVAPQ